MEDNSEDENIGASPDTEPERGGSSPENKRLKLEKKKKVDRISDLPDALIQHILSFLPSTKEAIRTGILSKRWKNQWTRVPVLIFYSTGMSGKTFSQFIDTTLTLHNCPKLNKFHIRYDSESEPELMGTDPHLTSKIHFAIRKGVVELILHLNYRDERVMDVYELILNYRNEGVMDVYELPESVLKNDSLVRLELYMCRLPDWRPNWPSLKELKLEGFSICHYGGIENVVSGCLLLELLELSRCSLFYPDVIASKSLKRLIFIDAMEGWETEHIEILCPNLEQLSVKISKDGDILWSRLPNQTIEKVLSNSPLLHTLELLDFYCSGPLVIASKSLKKLVLGNIFQTSDYDISCPELEELNLYRFVPAACGKSFEPKSQHRMECLAIKILRQNQHVKLLEMGSLFIKLVSALEWEGLSLKLVSALEWEGLSSPLLNCKCLTLNGTEFDEHLPGIICVLRSSPALEKLVIKLQFDQLQKCGNISHRHVSTVKKHCNSVGTIFDCSVSNLKTVKIVGISKRDVKHTLVFNFVEFLLKNARMLEKIVIVLADRGTSFVFEVSKKLLSFQRCFPHTTIELLWSN